MLNNWMNALLFWLSGWLRCRLIKVHDRPYLERYYLGSVFGRHVYLHRFLDSDDPAQGVHDHPWDWSMSFIVCGKYMERRRWKTEIKRWFNFIGGDHFHLVLLLPQVYTWSIFVAGEPKPGRIWGMLREVDTSPVVDRGDVYWAYIPYEYGVGDHNPKPGQWWLTEPRGRFQQRERRTYVREQG